MLKHDCEQIPASDGCMNLHPHHHLSTTQLIPLASQSDMSTDYTTLSTLSTLQNSDTYYLHYTTPDHTHLALPTHPQRTCTHTSRQSQTGNPNAGTCASLSAGGRAGSERAILRAGGDEMR